MTDPSNATLEDMSGWIELLTSTDVSEAVLMGLLLPTEWTHRRVETVTLQSMQRIRRRVSVDLTMGFATPSLGALSAGCRLVPVAMLKKRVLNSLDVVSADGTSLPVLTTRQNGALAAAVLSSAASMVVGAPVAWLDAELKAIACGAAPDAAQTMAALLETLRALPAGDPVHALAELPAFEDLLTQFADNFILATVVPGEDGCRTIVKVTYEEPTELVAEDLSRFGRLKQSLGLSSREYVIDIPGATTTESFHLEVAAPQGISVVGAAMFELGVAGAVSDPDALRGLETQPTSRSGVGQVHFHASQSCTSAAQVYVWLRIARGGWLRSAVLVTACVAILSIANTMRLSHLIDASKQPRLSTDVAALLMAVVALLASAAVRVGEHPMTVKTVSTLRFLTLVAVSLPLVEGWMLAFGPSGDALRHVWQGLALGSLLLFGLVLCAYVGPSPVTPNAYDSDL